MRASPPSRPSGRDDGPPGRGPGRPPVASGRRLKPAHVGRIALALVSLLVLGGTGYAWSTVSGLTSGLTTADVIDPHNQSASGPQNILMVGIDTRTDAQGNPLPASILNQLHAGQGTDGGDNTDTMIVVHIPAGGGQAMAFSIPRDSYVDLAGGYGKHKINSAYTYGQVAAAKQLRAQGVSGPDLNVQAAQAGAKNAIQTVENFTGLQINHFASVNLVGFYDISQAIGGVPVCLKAPVNDSYSGANFPAGQQTIQGAQALAFVRQRHGLPLGDLDRIKRQQAFMASMAHTILSAGVLTDSTKLNNLVGAIQKSITLDKGWDVLSFAQQMQGMTAGAIQFKTIPIVSITYPTPSDGDAVEVDPQAVRQFVQQTINGGPSAAPGSVAATTPAAGGSGGGSSASNSAITVDVKNSSGRTGLAAEVMSSLTGAGFTQGTTGVGTARGTSVVDYAPGEQASAQQVVSALGGGITMVRSGAVSSGSVVVYLGRDYSGPHGGAASNSSGGSANGLMQGSPMTPAAAAAPTPPPITAGSTPCIN